MTNIGEPQPNQRPSYCCLASKVLAISLGIIMISAGICSLLSANQILPNFIPLQNLYTDILGAGLIFAGSALFILGIYLIRKKATRKLQSDQSPASGTPVLTQVKVKKTRKNGTLPSLPHTEIKVDKSTTGKPPPSDAKPNSQIKNSNQASNPPRDVEAEEKSMLLALETGESSATGDWRRLLLCSNYKVDVNILQFILADFVGGGHGEERYTTYAEEFFIHYLKGYLSLFPEDVKAQQVLNECGQFFEMPNGSLEEIEEELLKRLQLTGYVQFVGGFHNVAVGHAILCELILKGDQVVFKITNTGDGSQFHPRYPTNDLNREKYYRTLIFTETSLEELKKVEFLKLLVSFRMSERCQGPAGILPKETQFSALVMCSLLIQAWPGSNVVFADNPGGGQRANSCSVLAAVRKIRGNYHTDSKDYMHLDFWIKINALNDCLLNQPELSPQFITDSVYKISTLASKMKNHQLLSEEMFLAWGEVYSRAMERVKEKTLAEEKRLLEAAFELPEDIDWGRTSRVTCPAEKIDCQGVDSTRTFEYTHRFLGESQNLQQGIELANPFIASAYDEMAYKLNFLRTLPDFNEFDYSQFSSEPDWSAMEKRFKKTIKRFLGVEKADLIPQTFFEHTGIKQFIEMSDKLPDVWRSSFFANLQGKITLFFDKEGTHSYLPDEFFVKSLLESLYADQSINEFNKLVANKPVQSTKRRVFFNSLLKMCQYFFYQEAYTSVHVPDSFFPDLLNGWMIGYTEAVVKGSKITPAVRLEWMRGLELLIDTYFAEYIFDHQRSRERFYSIKHFCKQEIANLLAQLKESTPHYQEPSNQWAIYKHYRSYGWSPYGDVEKNDALNWRPGIKAWNDLPAMAQFAFEVTAGNSAYQRMHKSNDRDYLQAIKLFSYPLKEIPHYDLLRKSLAYFFSLADRHIEVDRPAGRSTLPIECYPNKNSDVDPDMAYMTIGVRSKEVSHRPGVHEKPEPSNEHYHPETQLPLLAKEYQGFADFNTRTSIALQRKERALPFFSQEEEFKALLSIVRDGATALTESLKFFEGKWGKLLRVDYQSALEWMFFGNEGGALLDSLFKNHGSVLSRGIRTLLFDFIKRGHDHLLGSERIEPAAGFLFHIHLRLCQFAIDYQTEDAPTRVNELFYMWELLLERGKKNGFLAKALGEGVFAALPAIVCSKTLREDPRMLKALAATFLLDCACEEVSFTKYDQLTLTYGYHAFKEMLARTDPEIVWRCAAEKVFDKIEPITWDSANDTLKVGDQKFYLISRTVEGGAGKKMRPLPSEITKKSDYKTLFGDKKLKGTPFREGERESYWVTWKNKNFVLYLAEKKLNIFQMIDGELYRFSTACSGLGPLFHDGRIFWVGRERILNEKLVTKEIEAVVDAQGVHSVCQGQISYEVLGALSDIHPLRTLFARVESPEYTNTWVDPQNGKISHIELPHLKLSFECKIVDGKTGKTALFSVEHPDFSFAKIQYAPCLKNFTSYLLLENAKGQKKVLLPVRSLALEDYMPYSQEELTSKEPGDEQRVVVLDIEKKEIYPQPTSDSDFVYSTLALINLYLATHQYKQALTLLKSSAIIKKKTLQPHERKLLKSILQKDDPTLDRHPHAVSIRMRLFLLAIELQMKERGSLGSKLYDRFIEDFKRYKDLHHSVGEFKVSEQKLEKLNRACPLLPRSGQPLDIALALRADLEAYEGLWKIREKIYDYRESSPLPLTSLAAPGEEFLLNFLPYYAIAKKGSDEEKCRLKRFIATCCQDTSPLIALLCVILVFALKSDESPSVEETAAFFQEDDEEMFSYKFRNLSRQSQNFIKEVHDKKRTWLTGKNEMIAFKTVEQEKPSFSPLPPIPEIDFLKLDLANVSVSGKMDNILIDKAIVISTKESHDQEIAATQTFIDWTAQKGQAAEKKGNLLLAHEFTRLYTGAVQHLKDLQKASRPSFSLSRDLTSVQTVLENYKEEIKKQKSALEILENKILGVANDIHHNKKVKLEQMRNLRPQFDIQILMIAFGREDYSAIKNINPTLSRTQIKEIMKEVSEYIGKYTEMQKLVRCRSKLKEYAELLEENENEANLKAASDEYFIEQQAKRHYIPAKHPKLFAFEALANLLVRKEQIRALHTLTKEGAWTLFEARTGFGKSKVLLPLWLLLLAEPDHLACMIAPETLFDQQQLYLQQVLHKAYRLFALRLDFSRDSECSPQVIAALIHKLKKAQRLRKPVFMSDQSAANLFVLKTKELFTQAVDQSSAETVGLLLELRHYMKENGVVFIDEPHKVLDDSQESNYSIGRLHLFDEERLLFGLQIYFHFFKEIENKFTPECWQSVENRNLPTLTEESFFKHVLENLVIRMNKEKLIQTDILSARYLLGNMTPEEQVVYEKSLELRSDSLNAMKIRVLHDQVHHYLPQTLSQNAHEHYACQDPENLRTGIPLECARNPKKGNEFCSPDQIINFTIQANLATPFSSAYIENYFDSLLEQTLQELDANKPLQEIAAYQKFLLITKGMGKIPNLFKMQLEDLKRIRHHITNDIEARLHFIGCAVLPHLTRYEKKATCTPHLLIHCFKTAVGSAGTLTLENLPTKFTIKADEKAIAKTLITLIKKYTTSHSPAVVEISAKKAQEIVTQLPLVASHSRLNAPSVLLEIGALMRDYSSLVEFAQDLLTAFVSSQFEGVATFDERGSPIVLEAKSSRFIPLSVSSAKNLFWVYLQKDITGTDNKLPPLAQALAGINKHTTLTELVQGIGRLRGIHASQDARFFLGEDSLEIRKKLKKDQAHPLTHFDLIEYCTIQQAEMKGKMNAHSLPIKWDALFENIFWDHALSLRKQPLEAAHDFSLLAEPLLLENTPDSPLTRPSLNSIELPTEQALPQMRLKQTKKLEKIKTALTKSQTTLHSRYLSTTLSDDIDLEMKKMHFASSIALHGYINTQTTIASSTALAQSEAQTAQQRVLDIHGDRKGEQVADNTTESTNLFTTLAEKLGKRQPLPYSNKLKDYSIEEVFAHPKLQPFIPLFSSKIFTLSANCFLTFQGDSLSNPGWINGWVKELHYLWLQHNEKGDLEHCTLLDAVEAGHMISQADVATDRPGTLWLINQGVVFSQQGKTTEGLYQDDTIVKLELQVKILDGNCSLEPRQKEVLKKWMTPSTRDLCLRFFKEILIPLDPQLANSSDYRMLEELFRNS